MRWELQQLITALSLAGRIESEHKALPRLAALAPAHTSTCLSALGAWARNIPHPWTLQQQEESIRAADGPRAFSQAHFADTKERENAAEILRAAGASDDTITALGIARSGYIGVGGPVGLPGCQISKLRGPVLLRADDPALAHATAQAKNLALLLVENLQAAESACDRYPGLVVIHTSGQPDDEALPFIAHIATSAAQVIIIPDADLGGARIAQRILTALPDVGQAVLIDIGTQPHPMREPFGPVSMNGLQALAATANPVALFAAACLARGYPVEQEAATVAAIAAALKKCGRISRDL